LQPRIQLDSPRDVRPRWIFTTVLAAALVAGGCGPPAPKRPNFFTLKPTSKCLEKEGAAVRQSGLGFIMGTAPNGAIRIRFQNGKELLIGFGNNDQDAADLAAAFRQTAQTKAERKRLNSLLEPRGNVLIQWQTEPTPAEIDLVHGCLSS
jgi:hypothetical protein